MYLHACMCMFMALCICTYISLCVHMYVYLCATDMHVYISMVTNSIHLQLLQTELGNRAYLGELTVDSSNVVDLVETLYNVRMSVVTNLHIHVYLYTVRSI